MAQHVVFVFGAGGYIGEGAALAFRRAGWKVLGLVRDPKKAEALARAEITPVLGDQSKPETYLPHLQNADVIVDAVGMTDFSPKFLTIISDAVSKLPTPPLFIFTSGIMTYGNASTDVVDENVTAKPMFPDMVERKDFELAVANHASLRTVVVRPGFVFGGHGGPIADIFFTIPSDPSAPLVIQGSLDKRWSWVHVDDLGEGFALIGQLGVEGEGKEKGNKVNHQFVNLGSERDSPRYEDLRVTLAKAAGWKGTEVKTEHVPDTEIRVRNWEATVVVSEKKAKEVLGWKPKHTAGFLNEIETYHASWKAAKRPSFK